MNDIGKQIKSCMVKQKKHKIFCICALALTIAVAIVIVMLMKNSSDVSGDTTALQGTWRYDEHTEYVFGGNGRGCLHIDDTNDFKFAYTVEDSVLKLDFVPDYVTDCEYDFKLEGDKLTLIGGNGTANLGQEYKLNRER